MDGPKHLMKYSLDAMLLLWLHNNVEMLLCTGILGDKLHGISKTLTPEYKVVRSGQVAGTVDDFLIYCLHKPLDYPF
jgi:hypothetical protein